MAYGFSRTLTIDHTKCGAGNSTNFPVLVSVSDTTMKSVANSGHINNSTTQAAPAVTMPADLIFTSDAGGTTKIPWEVEFWDATNGILIAWVQIGTLSASVDTVFYMFYGDSGVTTAQNTSTVSPQNVWDSNYKGVWHLPNGSSLVLSDSTSNSNTISNTNGTAGTGQIDGCISLGATAFTSANAGGILTANAWTLSMWAKRDASDSGLTNIWSMEDSAGAFLGTAYWSTSFNGIIATRAVADNAHSTQPTASITLTNWHHWVFSYSGSGNTMKIYCDGSDVSAAGTANLGFVTPGVNLLNLNYGLGGAFHGISLNDEVRLSSLARANDWILAEYNNQFAPGNIGAAGFITYGNENGGGGTTPITKLVSDTNTLSDAFALLVGMLAVPADTNTLSDSQILNFSFGLTLTETETLSDTLGISAGYFGNLSDSLSLTEQPGIGFGDLVSDAFSFSDNVSNNAHGITRVPYWQLYSGLNKGLLDGN